MVKDCEKSEPSIWSQAGMPEREGEGRDNGKAPRLELQSQVTVVKYRQ